MEIVEKFRDYHKENLKIIDICDYYIKWDRRRLVYFEEPAYKWIVSLECNCARDLDFRNHKCECIFCEYETEYFTTITCIHDYNLIIPKQNEDEDVPTRQRILELINVQIESSLDVADSTFINSLKVT